MPDFNLRTQIFFALLLSILFSAQAGLEAAGSDLSGESGDWAAVFETIDEMESDPALALAADNTTQS